VSTKTSEFRGITDGRRRRTRRRDEPGGDGAGATGCERRGALLGISLSQRRQDGHDPHAGEGIDGLPRRGKRFAAHQKVAPDGTVWENATRVVQRRQRAIAADPGLPRAAFATTCVAVEHSDAVTDGIDAGCIGAVDPAVLGRRVSGQGHEGVEVFLDGLDVRLKRCEAAVFGIASAAHQADHFGASLGERRRDDLERVVHAEFAAADGGGGGVGGAESAAGIGSFREGAAPARVDRQRGVADRGDLAHGAAARGRTGVKVRRRDDTGRDGRGFAVFAGTGRGVFDDEAVVAELEYVRAGTLRSFQGRADDDATGQQEFDRAGPVNAEFGAVDEGRYLFGHAQSPARDRELPLGGTRQSVLPGSGWTAAVRGR
jgi:hypothetical protein